MLAWCSQKIGSWAAVFGTPIQPPTATCTLLCGFCSSRPDPGLFPPKFTAGPVNAVWLRALAGSQIAALSQPVPALMEALRFVTKSLLAAVAGVRNGAG